jgi:hypothetical protein
MSGSHLCIPRNETVQCAASLFPKQHYNVLSPNSYPHISVRDLNISMDRSVYFAAAKYVDRSWEYINRSQTHECENWDYAQFPEKEYINGIFVAVRTDREKVDMKQNRQADKEKLRNLVL